MSDQPTSKPMAMLLQDPTWQDRQGEYLHEDYLFPLDQNFLVGTGSSKFIVRESPGDSPDWDTDLEWGDGATGLAYKDFKQRASSILDNSNFHKVNAFAVASHTLHNVEKALGREITWRHGRALEIRPHAPLRDSYYDPFSLSLNFGFSESRYGGKKAWHCLSHDMVSHETAHAIWDSFRPLFVYSGEIDSHAVQEAVCDLLGLFSKLEHPALVEWLYRDSRDKGVVAPCATFFYMPPRNLDGDYISERNAYSDPLAYRKRYLRPANLIDQHYDPEEPKEPHARSAVWTGAICDILDKLRETLVSAETKPRKENSDDFTEAVVSAVDQIRRALLSALHYVPLSGVTMPLLARLFCEANERLSPGNPTLGEIAKEVFEKRNLWDSGIRLDRAPSNIGQTWVEDFEKSDTARRTQMVIEQAKALRIPLAMRPRVLTPRLVRANKEIYLYFAYELVDTIDAPIYKKQPKKLCWDRTGEMERVRVPSYYGATLVLYENYANAGILVTDPPVAETGTQESAPALRPAHYTDYRSSTIKGHSGYLLRHVVGDKKIPGFAGFDSPEFDGQEGEIAMTSNEEESRGPEGLAADPLVENLAPDPSEVPSRRIPATVLEGLLSRSDRDGYRRLYFTEELDAYVEIREEDVLHREPIAKERPPFEGLESTKLWVKRNAQITHTRIGSPAQVQAWFLVAGDIAIGSTAAAGPTAGSFGAQPAGAPPAPFNSDWCPPTQGPGCGSIFRRCR
jgi:hypothetical protein